MYSFSILLGLPSGVGDGHNTVSGSLLQAYGNISFTSKEDGSPVTKLDVQVEKLLRERLTTIAPATGFYGEETAHDRLAKTSWLVDPIDGTDAFIRGLPMCSNLISLLEDGQITLGVIYNFAQDEFYHAIRGQGAYMNGQKITVSNRPFKKSTVIYESSTDYVNEFIYARSLSRTMSAGQVAQRVMYGYDLALIAAGKIDGATCKEPYEHIWDVAPGVLIEEAGGIIRNLQSGTYNPSNLDFIASTCAIYDKLKTAKIV